MSGVWTDIRVEEFIVCKLFVDVNLLPEHTKQIMVSTLDQTPGPGERGHVEVPRLHEFSWMWRLLIVDIMTDRRTQSLHSRW